MPHDVTLIATIAAGLGLALIMGFLATRIGVPPLVGYLVAGIIAGPATPGFVADVELTQQLAEIGVMLMMFGVGLHLSLDDLLQVRRIAVPGALVQVAVATVLGGAIAMLWGWNRGAAVVFGLALSVASTVVVLRTLESRGLLNSVAGRIAVGWLVVEDLFMVLVLVLLPPLAEALGGRIDGIATGPNSVWKTLAVTLGEITAFLVVMWIAGRRILPRLLWAVARTGSRELFTLAVISVAVGVAYASAELFSVSFAIGAFVAGMMMRESALSHRAAEESLPFRDAFSVLFFVSVGMLFDPSVVLEEPLKLLAVLGIVLVAPMAAVVLVLSFHYPLSSALTVGSSLTQIGEFSFILAGLGVSLGLLSSEGQSLILAGSLISITLNPLVFTAIESVREWAGKQWKFARALEHPDDPLAELPPSVDVQTLTNHVLLVGYGRVGKRIAQALDRERIRYVVAEQNRELVEQLRGRGVHAVSGDASEPEVLVQAHVVRAGILVVATPDTLKVRKIAEIARTLNPRIQILLRTHSDEEAALLQRENLGKVFMGEHELALAMAREVLNHSRSVSAAELRSGDRLTAT